MAGLHDFRGVIICSYYAFAVLSARVAENGANIFNQVVFK